MEPTTTPPWRVLDAPTAPPGQASPRAPGPTVHGEPTAGREPLLIRIVAATGGVLACIVIAFALALGGEDATVVVDGSAGLSSAGVPGSTDPGLGTAVDAAPLDLVVEVVGAISAPGVYRLPAGSRVGDLVAAAGGYSPRVDTLRAARDLRLAQLLADGDQVRVPSRDDPVEAVPASSAGPVASGGTGGTAGGALVDLNHASQSELEDLPGIGPVTAGKIIAAREEAPFAAVEELRSRGILGEKTFEQLRALVTAS